MSTVDATPDHRLAESPPSAEHPLWAEIRRLGEESSRLSDELRAMRMDLAARTSSEFPDACAKVRAALAAHRSLAPLSRAIDVEYIASAAVCRGALDALPEAMEALSRGISGGHSELTRFAAASALVIVRPSQQARARRQP